MVYVEHIHVLFFKYGLVCSVRYTERRRSSVSYSLLVFPLSLSFALSPLKNAILLSILSPVHMQTMLLCCQRLKNSEMTKPTCLRGAPVSNPFGVRRAKGTRSETRQSSLQKICKPANVGSSSETNSKEIYMR